MTETTETVLNRYIASQIAARDSGADIGAHWTSAAGWQDCTTDTNNDTNDNEEQS